jgi:tRNA dimethylallyltransferase
MKPINPVIILLGATAVGKTELSIELADAIGAEIISIDSRLLYKGMDIGTAKPSPERRQAVNHHLIDVADPNERWSLSRYLKALKNIINELHAAGSMPLLVGGTGQYIAAIIEGWQPPPKAEDPGYRDRLREIADREGHDALHMMLERVDPITAERIDARNIRRVVRALEIYHVTGQPPSKQRKKSPPDYSFLLLGLRRDREELYERIDERIQKMIENGWVDEVKDLLDRGVDPESPALSAIGYRQIARSLRGELTLDAAIEQTRRLTRQFVRRQDNWFRRFEPEIHWFEAKEKPAAEIVALATSWLSGELI